MSEPTPAQALADQITDQDQALEVFHALRDRFCWSGTVFTADDVNNIVEAIIDAEDQPHLYGYANALRDEVVNGYAYRRLADRMSELGNALLTDDVALSDIFRAPKHGFPHFWVALGDVTGAPDETVPLDRGPFCTSAEADAAGRVAVTADSQAFSLVVMDECGRGPVYPVDLSVSLPEA